jgi:hypothetical protein
MFHLPDLPIVGYATTRERALTDNLMEFLRQIERDRVRLLTIVVEGKEKWRRVAGDIWRGYRISEEDQTLDEMFKYMTLLACPPRVQAALLRSPKNVLKWSELMRQAMPGIEAEREMLVQKGVSPSVERR